VSDERYRSELRERAIYALARAQSNASAARHTAEQMQNDVRNYDHLGTIIQRLDIEVASAVRLASELRAARTLLRRALNQEKKVRAAAARAAASLQHRSDHSERA